MIHVAHTHPYPWPYDGRLDLAAFAFVVLGDQIGLAAISSEVDPTRAGLARLATSVAGRAPVIRVRFGTTQGRRSPMPVIGTTGWALATPAPCDLLVDAPGWDATFATSLEVELRQRGITTLALGGLASEWTVDSTVRTLNDRGFECLVLTDGCAPVDHELGARAHASLTMSGGIFGALGTIPALIAALDAAHLQEDSR